MLVAPIETKSYGNLLFRLDPPNGRKDCPIVPAPHPELLVPPLTPPTHTPPRIHPEHCQIHRPTRRAPPAPAPAGAPTFKAPAGAPATPSRPPRAAFHPQAARPPSRHRSAQPPPRRAAARSRLAPPALSAPALAEQWASVEQGSRHRPQAAGGKSPRLLPAPTSLPPSPGSSAATADLPPTCTPRSSLAP